MRKIKSPCPASRFHSPTERAGHSRNRVAGAPIQAEGPVPGTAGLCVLWNTGAGRQVNVFLIKQGKGAVSYTEAAILKIRIVSKNEGLNLIK